MTAFAWAVAALALASVADVISTRAGLRTGRAYERNPLMRWFTATLARALAAKCAGLALAFWQLALLAPEHPTLAIWIAWVGAVLTSRVAYNNFRLAVALKRDTGNGCGSLPTVRDSA